MNWAFENGLSFDTRGREWVRVMPRSISSIATVFEVIEVPRSAWTVCGAEPFRATAVSMNSAATTESSEARTIQPGEYLE